MSRLIRVGSGPGDNLTLFLNMTGVELSTFVLNPKQAADLHVQLGSLLPDELLNVEPFSSDEIEEPA